MKGVTRMSLVGKLRLLYHVPNGANGSIGSLLPITGPTWVSQALTLEACTTGSRAHQTKRLEQRHRMGQLLPQSRLKRLLLKPRSLRSSSPKVAALELPISSDTQHIQQDIAREAEGQRTSGELVDIFSLNIALGFGSSGDSVRGWLVIAS